MYMRVVQFHVALVFNFGGFGCDPDIYTFPLCELEDRGEEGDCAAAAVARREDRA